MLLLRSNAVVWFNTPVIDLIGVWRCCPGSKFSRADVQLSTRADMTRRSDPKVFDLICPLQRVFIQINDFINDWMEISPQLPMFGVGSDAPLFSGVNTGSLYSAISGIYESVSLNGSGGSSQQSENQYPEAPFFNPVRWFGLALGLLGFWLGWKSGGIMQLPYAVVVGVGFFIAIWADEIYSLLPFIAEKIPAP